MVHVWCWSKVFLASGAQYFAVCIARVIRVIVVAFRDGRSAAFGASRAAFSDSRADRGRGAVVVIRSGGTDVIEVFVARAVSASISRLLLALDVSGGGACGGDGGGRAGRDGAS